MAPKPRPDSLAAPAGWRRAGRAVAVALLLAVAAAGWMVHGGRGPLAWERPVVAAVAQPGAWWWHLGVHGGDPVVVALCLLGVLGWAWRVGHGARGLRAVVGAVAAISTAELVAKPLVGRLAGTAYTFPSGHTTAAAAAAMALVLLVAPALRRRSRIALAATASGWVAVVAVSVVGARWHYPLDALAGIALGAAGPLAGCTFGRP